MGLPIAQQAGKSLAQFQRETVDGGQEVDPDDGRCRLVGKELNGIDIGIVQGPVGKFVVYAEQADRLPFHHYRTEDKAARPDGPYGIEGRLNMESGGILANIFNEIKLLLGKTFVDDPGSPIQRQSYSGRIKSFAPGCRDKIEMGPVVVRHEYVDSFVAQDFVQSLGAERQHLLDVQGLLDPAPDLVKVFDIVVQHYVAVLENLLLGSNFLMQRIKLYGPFMELIAGLADEIPERRHHQGGACPHVDIKDNLISASGNVGSYLLPEREAGLREIYEPNGYPGNRGRYSQNESQHGIYNASFLCQELLHR